ncbi:hypothetical protein Pint_27648 [Pistacia integerrima]|uniref:Uncharacterized protein n=1 Tax=Pistacia integerrima TaxID=434235 RepID=A0ACC0YSB7_9ROSI|nr:hypothetical protein Pint_27648 [Pistacia integerrima]
MHFAGAHCADLGAINRTSNPQWLVQQREEEEKITEK